jgi:hypothetical protein
VLLAAWVVLAAAFLVSVARVRRRRAKRRDLSEESARRLEELGDRRAVPDLGAEVPGSENVRTQKDR